MMQDKAETQSPISDEPLRLEDLVDRVGLQPVRAFGLLV